MKKQPTLKIKQLSTMIGHFIRYWGFRKIHGEIWTLVYLTKEPLSGVEIGKLLKVSKALISPALKELEKEGLIKQVLSENSKTKRYEAEEDITKIIHGVLKRREKPMLDKIHKSYLELSQKSNQTESFNLARFEKMGLMIQMSQVGLESLLQMELI